MEDRSYTSKDNRGRNTTITEFHEEKRDVSIHIAFNNEQGDYLIELQKDFYSNNNDFIGIFIEKKNLEKVIAILSILIPKAEIVNFKSLLLENKNHGEQHRVWLDY